MRTLSPALIAELGLTITRPGYLVSIAFDTPLYLSTLGDVTWGGHTWLSSDVDVGKLTRGSSAAQVAGISLGNLDALYSAIVLNGGVADRAVAVYAVYAGAPADAVLEFSGVGDDVEVGDRVNISLVSRSTQEIFAPRRRIGPATGFSILLPAGTLIPMGNTTYVLERA